MPSLSMSDTQLRDALGLLMQQWQATCALWSDDAQRRFARQYMEEYEPVITALTRELERLDSEILQARREVR